MSVSVEGIQFRLSEEERAALKAAKDYGIDLSLLEENLRLTPTERLEKLRARLAFSEELAKARKTASVGNL